MFGLFKKTRALIVVDVQNDFVPGGALAVPKGDEVVAVVNKLMGEYDLVVATRDWHPPDHCSFATSHRGGKVGDRIDLERGSQLLWPKHCVQKTPGADFVPALDKAKFAKVFDKGIDRDIDSYSGLFDNDRGRATGLEEFLLSKKVSEVHLVGLATDYCVKYTAVDCAKGEFKNTTVILEGCRGLDMSPGDVDRAINDMKRAGVVVK